MPDDVSAEQVLLCTVSGHYDVVKNTAMSSLGLLYLRRLNETHMVRFV
jgi:hypothetical protein